MSRTNEALLPYASRPRRPRRAASIAVRIAFGLVFLVPAVPAAAQGLRVVPLRVSDEDALRAAKRAAAQDRGGSRLRTARPGPLGSSSVFGGLNQPGLAAVDNAARNDGTPPDTTGAIGPSHYLEFVNTKIAVYDRTNLPKLSDLDGDTFVGAGPNATTFEDVFDVQVLWDPQANRWFYLSDRISENQTTNVVTNFLAYGWSKTADPSDLVNGWCRFSINTGAEFEDYPKLGHNDNHLVFGANVFDESGGFLTARIRAVPKPAAGDTSCTQPAGMESYGTAASPLLTSDGDTVFTPVPANTFQSAANGYVVAADDPLETGTPTPRNQIAVFHVQGPSNNPDLIIDGNVNVSPYNIPPNAPQPLPGLTLDTLDARLTQAVARDDPATPGQLGLWTQHTIAGGGRSVVRWYELLPASTTARQQGDITDPSNFLFNGAISPSSAGSEAGISYSVSSSAQLPQIRARTRLPTTPLSVMGPEITLGTSTNPAQDFSCTPLGGGPPCRWGDYAGASPDPNNPNVIWGSNQLVGPPRGTGGLAPAWLTRNFALLASNQAPSASFTASPNPAQTGQTVTFNGGGSSDPDGTVVSYSWDLDGNGSFETNTGGSPTVSRSYPSPGTVNVGLMVTDNDGGTGQTAQALAIQSSGAGPAGAGGTAARRLRIVISRRPVTLTRRGRARVRLFCRGGRSGVCAGTFRLVTAKPVRVGASVRRRRITLGRKRFRIAAGRSAVVRVKLSRANRRRVARLRRLRVVARAGSSSPARVASARRAVLTLKAPPRRRRR